MKLITLTLLALILVIEVFQSGIGKYQVINPRNYAAVKCYICGDFYGKKGDADSCRPEKDDPAEALASSCYFIGNPIYDLHCDELQKCGRDLKNISECGRADSARVFKKCVHGVIKNCLCALESCDDVQLGNETGREGSAEGKSTSSPSVVTFDIIFAGYTFILQFFLFQLPIRI